MNTLIIIGNSGAARECYQMFNDICACTPLLRGKYTFKGFLSHQGYAGNLGGLASFDLGSDEVYQPLPEDNFIAGIGQPELRKVAYERMKGKNGVFINLISPWVYLPLDVTLGAGNIIRAGCSFSCDVSIGNNNFFNGGVIIAHDVTIGDNNFFGPDSMILGGAKIGDDNSFAVRSVVLERGKVGNGNLIAPGAILYKGCKDNCRMAGNPALKIGMK